MEKALVSLTKDWEFESPVGTKAPRPFRGEVVVEVPITIYFQNMFLAGVLQGKKPRPAKIPGVG